MKSNSLLATLIRLKDLKFDGWIQNLSLFKVYHSKTLISSSVLCLSLLVSNTAFSQARCEDVFASTAFHETSSGNPQAEIWRAWASGRPGDALFYEKTFSEKMQIEKMQVLVWIDRDNAIVRFESGFEGVWRREEMSPGQEDVNLAAVAVARKLRLFVAPLEILRTLDGQSGSVQLRAKPVSETDLVASESSFALFDFLVQNSERKSGTYILSQDKKLLAIRLDGAFKGKAHSSALEFPKLVTKYLNLHQKATTERESIERKLTEAKSGKRGWFGFKKYDISKLESELEAAKSKEVGAREQALASARAILFYKLQNKILIETSREEWQKILSPYLKQQSIDAFVERINEYYNLTTLLENSFGLNIYAKDGSTILMPAAEAFGK